MRRLFALTALLPYVALGGEAPTGFVGRDAPKEVSFVTDRVAASGITDALQHCHGDCDADADCGHGLFCYQRVADEVVPGCNQVADRPATHGNDYCVARKDHPDLAPVEKNEDGTTTHNNFFAAHIKITDWKPCSHIKCQVEDHDCTHETHENYKKDTQHDAPNFHGTHKFYPGAGKVYARPCTTTRSMRVYHHSQEQAGLAHRCATNAKDECFCHCAHKDETDHWMMLADEASGLYAPTTATCPDEAALLEGQRCTSRQINGTPNNPLLSTTEYAVCKAECDKLGSGCVEFGQGVCRCFDKKLFQPPHLEPASGPQYAGVKSAACTDNVQHPDRLKALEYYGKAAALGNKRAEARILLIHQSMPLFGHFSKQEHVECDEIDINSTNADPTVALTARCTCQEGFWKVNAGHIFMTKCAPCPDRAHAVLSSVGTNTCSCDDGFKLTVQDTELVCELPEHPADAVARKDISLDTRDARHPQKDLTDAPCKEIDFNSIDAGPDALTARCQCNDGFWKVNAGHIFMTKCAACPAHAHAKLSSVGTNTCACDGGYKLTAQGADLVCELPEHPADAVAHSEGSEIATALDEQEEGSWVSDALTNDLVRGGNN